MKSVRVLAVAAVAALLMAACATTPVVRTRMAPQANLANYHTYAFLAKPGTDVGPYRSLTTQQLETDVGQELQSRGYVAAAAGEQPDLLVNFIVGAHDRVEGMVGGPGWGPGWGRWGPVGTLGRLGRSWIR